MHTLYEFELILSRDPTDDEYDSLHEAGCDDMTFRVSGGVANAAVDRHAPSFLEAVVSAIQQIESVGGLRVISVNADPELTIEQIAGRAKRSREWVRQLIGRRDFPAPVITTPRHRFWRWSEVAPYFGVDDPMVREMAPVARALNAWLELRATVPAAAPQLEQIEAALRAA